MVDTVTTAMGNDNDDWEVAVDTGEFDKRLEEQHRVAQQESISSTVNDDDNRNSSTLNFLNLNKPIRILKRPTSQSQLPVTNDITYSNKTAIISKTNNNNNNNLPLSNNVSSSTPVPPISIISRNQTKDSINSSQTANSSNASASQSTKAQIKTYEQRELEYRLARLRIMGEEESSEKDDEINPPIDSVPIKSDESVKSTPSSTTTLTFTINASSSHSAFQSHSTPGSFASNLYNLNNTTSNTGAIHFTPNTNSTGTFSQQPYRSTYSNMYPQMSFPSASRYPAATFYVSSPVASSSNYQMQSPMNNWYPYHHQQQLQSQPQPQQQNPYGVQQYGPQQ